MGGNYNPHDLGRTAELADSAAKAWAADLIVAVANGEQEGITRLLARYVPPASTSAMQARAAFLVLAGIAARSDPRLVSAVTGIPFARPKRKSAATKGRVA